MVLTRHNTRESAAPSLLHSASLSSLPFSSSSPLSAAVDEATEREVQLPRSPSRGAAAAAPKHLTNRTSSQQLSSGHPAQGQAAATATAKSHFQLFPRMTRFRSFSSLGRKAKAAEESPPTRTGEGEETETEGMVAISMRHRTFSTYSSRDKRTNISGRGRGRGETPSSVDGEKPPKPCRDIYTYSPSLVPILPCPVSAKGGERRMPSPIDTRRSSSTFGRPSPPQSPYLSSPSMHFLSSNDKRLSRQPDKLNSLAPPSHDEVLLPPQPAFLGGRSSSASNVVVMGSNNASTASVVSSSGSLVADEVSSTGSMRDHLRAKGDKGGGAKGNSKNASTQSTGTGGSSIKTFGRRFFARLGSPSVVATAERNVSSPPQSQRRPGLTPIVLEPMSQPVTMNNSKSPRCTSAPGLPGPAVDRWQPTPSLSSTSVSYSSSSCTSSTSNSPQMSSTLCFPSMPPIVATATTRGSYQTIAAVTKRNDVPQPASPLLPSPLASPSLDMVEREETSEFMKAMLDFAAPDEDVTLLHKVPWMPGSVKTLTRLEVSLLEEQERKSRGNDRSRRSMVLRSLWARQEDEEEEDSDDEYGKEGEELESARASPVQRPLKGKREAGGGKQPSVGLDTAAKKALHTCTLMKFHPQLASALLQPGQSAPIPANELRLPRSINAAQTLQGHPSSYSHSRSFRIALGRSQIVRRLRTEPLPLRVEQELEWFIRKYLPHFIPPEQLATQLAQRAAQSSLEALARPPLHQGKDNGMALWARRGTFEERTECICDDRIMMQLDTLKLSVGQVVNPVQERPNPMPLQLSKRCKALAGIATPPAAKPSVDGRQREAKPSASPTLLCPPSQEGGSEGSRRAPPWLRPIRRATEPVNASKRGGACSPSPTVTPVQSASTTSLLELLEDAEEEEDVPLAMLVDRRAKQGSSDRACSDSGSSTSEGFGAKVKQQRQKELAERRNRELKMIEDQKRLLGQARERRKQTGQAEVLSSPTYGAGNAALVETRRQSVKAASECGDGGGRRGSRNPYQAAPSPLSQHVHQQRQQGVQPSASQAKRRSLSSKTNERLMPEWKPSAMSSSQRTNKSHQTQSLQQPSLPPSTHRMSMVPHAMTPYGLMPIPSPQIYDPRQPVVVMQPPFYPPSPYAYPQPSSSPLIYLSPEQVPTSARRSKHRLDASP